MSLYQDKINSLLTAYLLQEGASQKTIKNYRSDIDDFFIWFSALWAGTGYKPSSLIDILKNITPAVIDQYKIHLSNQSKSEATITRRCSSIRALLRAAESSGLQKTPAINPIKPNTNKDQEHIPLSSMQKTWKEVEYFKAALTNQGIPESIAQKKASYVRDFLHWFHSQKNN